MDEILKDKRFASLVKDPKFRRIPKKERKVKIDNRFQSMFKDKKFSVKYTIDKRGRPINQTSVENLRKYYDLSSSEEESEEEKKEVKKTPKSGKRKNSVKKSETISDSEEESEDSEKKSDGKSKDLNMVENEKQLNLKKKDEINKITQDVKKKLNNLNVDYARGEGILFSDSSSEEESSDYDNEEEEEEEIEHNWGELDKEAETTDEVTNRLALCNMDWDKIRAVDLMVLFNSFMPSGGLIHSITIYPSEFGLQRMKEDSEKGPKELVESKDTNEENEDEDEEGSSYHREKLRQYELNKLKYYYAIIVCDSQETANKIYTECDGLEYESTATKLDLRFIPEDMTFDQEAKEMCDTLPDLTKYEPRQFTTTALQQVKVELTWDSTDPNRQELAQKLNSKKLDEINQQDIQAYLASGSSDEESGAEENEKEEEKLEENNTKNSLEKYKALIKNIHEEEEKKKNKDVELEFTWGLGVKEKAEKLIKEKMKSREELTPFEKFCEKRKEKKKAKRVEKARLKEKQKNSSESEDSVPSDIDMNDPYFAEEIDKSKKNKSKKRKFEKEDSEEERNKAELELLMMDEDDDNNKKHFNMKTIEEAATMSKSKKKRLEKKNKEKFEDNFEVDVDDPRFAALYTSHHYNIDPADPHFRKTKGTEALVKEKIKRRTNADKEMVPQTMEEKSNRTTNAELSALVKTIKRKAHNMKR